MKSIIINIVENSIDKIAGSPYATDKPLHNIDFEISGIMENIPADGICVEYSYTIIMANHLTITSKDNIIIYSFMKLVVS